MRVHSVYNRVVWVLVLLLLLLLFPWQVLAVSSLCMGTVVISDTQQQNSYNVLYDGIDIYFQAADYAKITRYTYQETEEAISYTLGQKTVVISKDKKHNVQIPALGVYKNYGLSLKGVVQNGGKTYIAGSELLPWLNVSVSEQDGVLIVVPDDKSFWEVYKDLNSNKDLFNLSKDFGDSAVSKTGLAAMLTFNMVTGLKIDNVLDNLPTDETISAYEKIYVDMATDETLVSEEASKYIQKLYTASNNIDTVEKVLGINEKALHSKLSQTLLEQGMPDEWHALEDFATQWENVRTTLSAAKAISDYIPLMETMKLIETQFYVTQDYRAYIDNLMNSGTRTGVDALALKKANADLKSRQSAAESTLLSSIAANLKGALKNPQISNDAVCKDISLYLKAAKLFYSTVFTAAPAFSDMSNIAIYSSIMNQSWNEGVLYTSQVATKDNLLMAAESYKVALKASKTCFKALQKTTDIRLLGFIRVIGDTDNLMKYRIDPINQKIAELSVTAKYRENDSLEGKDEFRKNVLACIKNCQISTDGRANAIIDEEPSASKNLQNTSLETTAIYKKYFYDHFKETDCVYLADVTHDGVQDMLVVQILDEDEITSMGDLCAWIFTVDENSEVKTVYEEQAGTDHAHSFFNWFVNKNGDGTSNLGREFDSWQGYGTYTFYTGYIDNDGNEHLVNQIEVTSDDPSSVGADGAITSEAMKQFNDQVLTYKNEHGFLKIFESYSLGTEYEVPEAETSPNVVFSE